MVGKLLDYMGRHGPLLLFAGAALGLILPTLAGLARPLMPFAVFVFTLGAFMRVQTSQIKAQLKNPLKMLLALGWSTIGVSLLMWMALECLPVSNDLTAGMALAMAAPPVGSAPAVAAMLGLNAALALLSTVSATIVAPLTVPPLANAMGVDLDLLPAQMMLRLALVIGPALLIAWILKRQAPAFLSRHPQAMTGLAVAGLILVALGAMSGMGASIVADPLHALVYAAWAFALNLAFQALGTLLAWVLGRHDALTIGLCSGNRNVTLIWVAAAPFLADHPDTELFLAMSIFPIFMLPLLQKLLYRYFGPGA